MGQLHLCVKITRIEDICIFKTKNNFLDKKI